MKLAPASTAVSLLKPGRRHHLARPTHPRGLPHAAAPIAILPFGEVPADELRFLDELMGAAYGADTLLLEAVETPRHAYSVSRAQYDADLLLDELFARLPERCLRVVGVTQADMYVAGRTFVFGYAHLSDGVAVYSSARFREEFYGRRRDLGRHRARVCRAVIHEVGHTFGTPPLHRCALRDASGQSHRDARRAGALVLRRLPRAAARRSAGGAVVGARTLGARHGAAQAPRVCTRGGGVRARLALRSARAALSERSRRGACRSSGDREGARAAFCRA